MAIFYIFFVSYGQIASCYYQSVSVAWEVHFPVENCCYCITNDNWDEGSLTVSQSGLIFDLFTRD